MPHMHMHDTHMHVDMRAQPITMTDALICRPSMLCNSCMLVGVKGGGGGGGGLPPKKKTKKKKALREKPTPQRGKGGGAPRGGAGGGGETGVKGGVRGV